MNSRRFTAYASGAFDRKDSTPRLQQEAAALRHFNPAYVAVGSNSAIPIMSDARPLFPRKRKSNRNLAMSHSCHNLTFAASIEHLVSARHQRQRHIDT